MVQVGLASKADMSINTDSRNGRGGNAQLAPRKLNSMGQPFWKGMGLENLEKLEFGEYFGTGDKEAKGAKGVKKGVRGENDEK